MSDQTPPPPAADATPPAPPAPPVAPPPPAPAAPAYGQQPVVAGPPTNTLAIVGMILSLAGLLFGITAPVGAILGHVALGQIKRTGEGGRPLALTAIIAGWVITGLGLLITIGVIIFYVAIFATMGASGAFTGYGY